MSHLRFMLFVSRCGALKLRGSPDVTIVICVHINWFWNHVKLNASTLGQEMLKTTYTDRECYMYLVNCNYCVITNNSTLHWLYLASQVHNLCQWLFNRHIHVILSTLLYKQHANLFNISNQFWLIEPFQHN